MSLSPAYEFAPMRDLNWSPMEKSAARRAFNLALGRELEAVMARSQGPRREGQRPSDLWELEGWLTERRRRSTASTTTAIPSCRSSSQPCSAKDA